MKNDRILMGITLAGLLTQITWAQALAPTTSMTQIPLKRTDHKKTKNLDPELAQLGKGKKAKICPVSGDDIKSGKGEEARLSNGKKIMLCCPDCVDEVEKNPKKYAKFMYD